MLLSVIVLPAYMIIVLAYFIGGIFLFIFIFDNWFYDCERRFCFRRSHRWQRSSTQSTCTPRSDAPSASGQIMARMDGRLVPIDEARRRQEELYKDWSRTDRRPARRCIATVPKLVFITEPCSAQRIASVPPNLSSQSLCAPSSSSGESSPSSLSTAHWQSCEETVVLNLASCDSLLPPEENGKPSVLLVPPLPPERDRDVIVPLLHVHCDHSFWA